MMTLSSGSILLGVLCLYLYSRGSILYSTWLSITTLESFRALRTVRPNGRRVGISTRRKALRQALISWIVFCAVSQVEPLISAVFGWLPFYGPIKWVISLAFLTARIPASNAVYTSSIRPMIRRYEKPIDLILLLLHSIFQLFTYFVILLPLDYLRKAGQGVHEAVNGRLAMRREDTLGTAISPTIINRASTIDRTDVDVMLPSDISLSTPNVPGRLISSARKRAALAQIQPISRAEIGESSRTPKAAKVITLASESEDNHEDVAQMDTGRIATPPTIGRTRIPARSPAALNQENADTLPASRTSHTERTPGEKSKPSEVPSIKTREVGQTASLHKTSDREEGRKVSPTAPRRTRENNEGVTVLGRSANALSSTARPTTTASSSEATIPPRVKAIYPPLPSPGASKTITTTTSVSRKRQLPIDTTADPGAEPSQPSARTRRKLGPPVRVLLDPPKNTSKGQNDIVSSRLSNPPTSSSDTVKQGREIPTKSNFVRKEATRPRVLSNKNRVSAPASQILSKKGLVDRDTEPKKVGIKRQAMAGLENPTMKRVKKTV